MATLMSYVGYSVNMDIHGFPNGQSKMAPGDFRYVAFGYGVCSLTFLLPRSKILETATYGVTRISLLANDYVTNAYNA